MKIVQVDKTMEYIFSHIASDELLFLIYDDHALRFSNTKVNVGRFSSKVVRGLSYNEIESLVLNEKTILVAFTQL